MLFRIREYVYIISFCIYCVFILKVLSNENRGWSKLVSIIHFDKLSCRQVSFFGPQWAPSRDEHNMIDASFDPLWFHKTVPLTSFFPYLQVSHEWSSKYCPQVQEKCYLPMQIICDFELFWTDYLFFQRIFYFITITL